MTDEQRASDMSDEELVAVLWRENDGSVSGDFEDALEEVRTRLKALREEVHIAGIVNTRLRAELAEAKQANATSAEVFGVECDKLGSRILELDVALAEERGRLDWLDSDPDERNCRKQIAIVGASEPGLLREAIDAAMQQEASDD